MNVKSLLFTLFLLTALAGKAQLSPGDLAEPHAHLEGMSNCTKCHTLGSKISNDKCLACHTEIKVRIDKKAGYHSSSKVYGKSCTICHSDHHGRQYRIINLDKSKFDHLTTGYKLEGKHASTQCSDCHQSSNIVDPAVKKKKSTYLGLSRECLSCHEDRHQGTLSSKCSSCHNFESFKPAVKFDHSKSDFTLKGKHKDVPCTKCHEISILNGREFQRFTGIKHGSCVNCHKDVHNNNFGQQCSSCHTEESFKIIRSLSSFDHSLTDFKLEGKHLNVTCNKCHKSSYTDPLKHEKCSDCHTDYHKGEFTSKITAIDCSSCHDVNGFSPSSFSIERHNTGDFKLEGAHLATPCIACHLKSDQWKFRNIGSRCSDCHTDIHKDYLDEKYYPQSECRACHSVESWLNITFNHSITKFPLEGKHSEQTCRSCHSMENKTGIVSEPGGDKKVLKFTGLPSECIQCHSDEHEGQFITDGEINCSKCHTPENWEASRFDHDSARFRLDGRHKDIACRNCHPIIEKETKQYVLYKTGKVKCADCH